MNRNLKYLRKKQNLTQAEFAIKAGIGVNVYPNYESNRSKMPAELIPVICKTLNISPNDLFGWEN